MRHATVKSFATLLLGCSAQWAGAGWSRDPSNNTVVVSSTTNTYASVDLCADGRGGAFLCWKQARTLGMMDYRAQIQQYNAQGELVWPLGAVKVTGQATSQYDVVLSSSTVGNCLVGWRSWYNNMYGYQVRVQRVSTPGVIPATWSTNGVTAGNTTNGMSSLQIVSDGSGGAIVAWTDYRNGDWRPYARRVDVNGSATWGPPWNGVPAASNTANSPLLLLPNGDCGAFLAWTRRVWYGVVSTPQIFVQQLNAYGSAPWPWSSNGVQVCLSTNPQWNAAIARDSSRNLFVAWEENRGSGFRICAQRISTNGECLWSSVGILVATSAPPQFAPCLVADGTGCVVIAYQANTDVYVQRINSFGQSTWSWGGVQLSYLGDDDDHQHIVKTSDDHYIVAWRSDRMDDWIVAQKINANGQVQWTPNGVHVGRAGTGSDPRLVADQSGGAIIAWEGTYGGTNAIKIQRINADGTLGGPPSGSSGWELLLLE